MATEADNEYYLPLVDQRVFGAGIKRKRVAFVPAKNDETSSSIPTAKPSNAANRYLSIVMKTAEPESETPSTVKSETKEQAVPLPLTCEICGQKVSEGRGVSVNSHETSIAHQMCLEHSHPPSHLDRSHVSLKYLQEYGWDPDARGGLGARREGIRVPIKAKQKNDSAGLGLLQNDGDNSNEARQKRKVDSKENHTDVVKLNAKEVRRMEEGKSRRAEKLHRSVYGEDLSRYLGSNG